MLSKVDDRDALYISTTFEKKAYRKRKGKVLNRTRNQEEEG